MFVSADGQARFGASAGEIGAPWCGMDELSGGRGRCGEDQELGDLKYLHVDLWLWSLDNEDVLRRNERSDLRRTTRSS